MDPLITQLGAAGITVAVLIGGMKWLSSRYEAMEIKLDASAKACAEREAALVQRVQSLEDGRNNDLKEAMASVLDSLRMSADALHANSGTFQAMARRPSPLPEED